MERWHACTPVKSLWILPIYVNEILYKGVTDIDFTLDKELKENLDRKTDSLSQKTVTNHGNQLSTRKLQLTSTEQINIFYEALNYCDTKAVVLNLIDPFAKQFEWKNLS